MAGIKQCADDDYCCAESSCTGADRRTAACGAGAAGAGLRAAATAARGAGAETAAVFRLAFGPDACGGGFPADLSGVLSAVVAVTRAICSWCALSSSANLALSIDICTWFAFN
jgi:hypothetical protein